jgi:hypothetical protein
LYLIIPFLIKQYSYNNCQCFIHNTYPRLDFINIKVDREVEKYQFKQIYSLYTSVLNQILAPPPGNPLLVRLRRQRPQYVRHDPATYLSNTPHSLPPTSPLPVLDHHQRLLQLLIPRMKGLQRNRCPLRVPYRQLALLGHVPGIPLDPQQHRTHYR